MTLPRKPPRDRLLPAASASSAAVRVIRRTARPASRSAASAPYRRSPALGRTPHTHDLLVDSVGRAADLGPARGVVADRAGALGEPLPQVPIVDRAAKRLGQRAIIFGRHEKRAVSVGQQLGEIA